METAFTNEDVIPVYAPSTGMAQYMALRDPAGQITDFRLVLLNEQAQIAWQRPVDELVGRSVSQLFSQRDAQLLIGRLREVVGTGQTVRFGMAYRREPDGTEPQYTVLASKLGDGVIMQHEDTTDRVAIVPLGDGVVATWTDISARKQADTLQQVVDNTQAGLMLARPIRDKTGAITDFRFVLSNAYNARMSGRTVADLTGKRLSDLFPDWQQDALFRLYVEVMETGQSQRQAFFYDRYGIQGWFDGSFSSVDGCLLYSYVDVTALKEAELALKRQNDLLMGIVETGKAGITLFDPIRDKSGIITDFRYVFTNAVNSRNTGRSVANLTGNTLLSVVPGIAQTDWYARLLHTATTGENEAFMFSYDAEGIRGWFDTLFAKLGDQVLFTDLNVTELKAAELARTKQANLLEGVMNTTPTAILVHESIRDEAGQIVDFYITQLNQSAATVFNITISDVQHRRVSRCFPGLLNTPLFEQFKQVVETGEPVRTSVHWGDEWYDFSVARFGDGFVAAAQNITAMQQYRDQLELANHELKRSNENLQSFAYVASHDLQEPLRKLISFASILQTQFADTLPPQVSDMLDRMNSSAERMRLLIQDLLAYSRVGTQQDSVKAVKLTKLIQDLQENELWSALYPHKANLHVGELPTLLADPFQMRQLFQNLLSNALKFCPKGTAPVVSVTSRLVDRAEVPASLLSPVRAGDNKPAGGAFYEIAVTDNGIGFDEKYLDRIFQVFQRLHGRNQYAGSGIGLAICQKIVERHHGAITATSKPDVGSTFRVFLPVKTPP